jgi:hypothetical protein
MLKSSPLVNYVMRGLRNCHLPDQNCWSYIYHLDGRAQPNQSLPGWDAFYSLNVVLGMATMEGQAVQKEYDLPDVLQHNAARLFQVPSPAYAKGMALWAAGELGVPLASRTADQVRRFVKDRTRWDQYRAQDAGMILSGMSMQKAKGNSEYDPDAHALFKLVKTGFLTEDGLFCDQPTGLRRVFSSFATQAYLTTGLYHYGQHYGNVEALDIADRITTRMLGHQGPQGEWPWFYYAPGNLVVDNYEVYSVHQDGMAPMFLQIAEQRGLPGAREAIVRGFEWLFGHNQLGRSMLVPELGMFYRSILRKGELTEKHRRVARAVTNRLLGRKDPLIPADGLMLRQECRSYHLGWVLYSFGTRIDLPEITEHPEFVVAGRNCASEQRDQETRLAV